MSDRIHRLLGIQERKIEKLTSSLSKQRAVIDEMLSTFKSLTAQNALSEKRIKELTIGSSFRKLMELAAEQVVPFHYIVDIVLPAAATNRVPQPLQTTSKGWFFADRVFASYRPTGNQGGVANLYRPLTHADPAVAVHDASGVGVAVPNVIDFNWDYSENRTNMARQNDSLTIPGDLLFRRDGDGFLLGGDPWAPRTTITPAVTPLVAPGDAGIFTFTFLGSLCLNTPESALQSWLERKSVLGL